MPLFAGCVALQTINAAVSLGSMYYAKKGYEIKAGDCDFSEPIYLEGSVEGLTDDDLRQIVNHNDKVEKFCNE